jgi:phosphoglucomutase
MLGLLGAEAVAQKELAGDVILEKSTRAPGNQKPLGGLKVVTRNGWFAVRPSGTEHKYKIYAESFVSEKHLEQIRAEAEALVEGVIH